MLVDTLETELRILELQKRLAAELQVRAWLHSVRSVYQCLGTLQTWQPVTALKSLALG